MGMVIALDMFDSPIDMTETARIFGVRLTPFEEVVRPTPAGRYRFPARVPSQSGNSHSDLWPAPFRVNHRLKNAASFQICLVAKERVCGCASEAPLASQAPNPVFPSNKNQPVAGLVFLYSGLTSGLLTLHEDRR